MFKSLLRPVLERLEPYVPGKPVEEVQRELGLKEVTKLASNENPWGMSPKARRAVRKEISHGHLYPEGSCRELREAIARFHGVDPSMVTVANGADNVLSLVAQAFVGPGEEAVMGAPTFPIYKATVLIMGGNAVEIPLQDHTLDIRAMAGAVTSRTKVIFVCNPNNPTGTVVDPGQLEDSITDAGSGVLWVMDEVYADFADPGSTPDTIGWIRQGRPILSVRSFSKLYGLAGLRVGYALGPTELIDALNRVREPFAVNRLAQAAATAALGDEQFREKVLEGTRRGRAYLQRAFRRMGLGCVPSQTNFVLVDLRRDAQEVYEGLLHRGIIVRPGRIWGLPTYCRVTVGRPLQNRALIMNLNGLLGDIGDL